MDPHRSGVKDGDKGALRYGFKIKNQIESRKNKWEMGEKGRGCTPSHRGFLRFFYILYISFTTSKCP